MYWFVRYLQHSVGNPPTLKDSQAKKFYSLTAGFLRGKQSRIPVRNVSVVGKKVGVTCQKQTTSIDGEERVLAGKPRQKYKLFYSLMSMFSVSLKQKLRVQRERERRREGERKSCLLYTSPSPRDRGISRMPSSA